MPRLARLAACPARCLAPGDLRPRRAAGRHRLPVPARHAGRPPDRRPRAAAAKQPRSGPAAFRPSRARALRRHQRLRRRQAHPAVRHAADPARSGGGRARRQRRRRRRCTPRRSRIVHQARLVAPAAIRKSVPADDQGLRRHDRRGRRRIWRVAQPRPHRRPGRVPRQPRLRQLRRRSKPTSSPAPTRTRRARVSSPASTPCSRKRSGSSSRCCPTRRPAPPSANTAPSPPRPAPSLRRSDAAPPCLPRAPSSPQLPPTLNAPPPRRRSRTRRRPRPCPPRRRASRCPARAGIVYGGQIETHLQSDVVSSTGNKTRVSLFNDTSLTAFANYQTWLSLNAEAKLERNRDDNASSFYPDRNAFFRSEGADLAPALHHRPPVRRGCRSMAARSIRRSAPPMSRRRVSSTISAPTTSRTSASASARNTRCALEGRLIWASTGVRLSAETFFLDTTFLSSSLLSAPSFSDPTADRPRRSPATCSGRRTPAASTASRWRCAAAGRDAGWPGRPRSPARPRTSPAAAPRPGQSIGALLRSGRRRHPAWPPPRGQAVPGIHAFQQFRRHRRARTALCDRRARLHLRALATCRGGRAAP